MIKKMKFFKKSRFFFKLFLFMLREIIGVNRAYLEDLANKLRRGETTMKEASEEGVIFDTIEGEQVKLQRSVRSNFTRKSTEQRKNRKILVITR